VPWRICLGRGYLTEVGVRLDPTESGFPADDEPKRSGPASVCPARAFASATVSPRPNSFAFSVLGADGEDWEQRPSGIVRTVKAAALYEISSTASPAYPCSTSKLFADPSKAQAWLDREAELSALEQQLSDRRRAA
jgi:hypothetical protein